MPGGKAAAAAAEAAAGRAGRAGLVFGDGQKVLDKGVWKRFKNCQHCQQLVVERAKWKDCWEEIKYCSDRCKSEGKRAKRQQQQQAQGEGEVQQQQQQAQGEAQREGASRSIGDAGDSRSLAA